MANITIRDLLAGTYWKAEKGQKKDYYGVLGFHVPYSCLRNGGLAMKLGGIIAYASMLFAICFLIITLANGLFFWLITG
jgi:hypothetical protein